MKLYRFLLSLTVIAAAPAADEKFPPMPPVKALPPAEAVKSFQLPVGYEMQLVVGEPVIKEPVVTVFDGNGRMFVAEMRTYMRDIDGRDENLRTSRISMHVSTKGDGNFDKHTVFADGLLLPRMILPLGKGQILINETHTQDILLLTDTDDDGVADRKELWFEGGSRSGNMEHQPSGLIWALDNSLYMTMTNYRLRWTPEGVKKEETKSNGGQWGVNQDDNGNLYFVNASGERGPTTFQAPQVYGTFNPPGQFLDGFKEVFPAAGLRDFQGGLSRVREPQGTLNGFTGGAGIEVYRGDQLPGAGLRQGEEPLGPAAALRGWLAHPGGDTALVLEPPQRDVHCGARDFTPSTRLDLLEDRHAVALTAKSQQCDEDKVFDIAQGFSWHRQNLRQAAAQ